MGDHLLPGVKKWSFQNINRDVLNLQEFQHVRESFAVCESVSYVISVY